MKSSVRLKASREQGTGKNAMSIFCRSGKWGSSATHMLHFFEAYLDGAVRLDEAPVALGRK